MGRQEMQPFGKPQSINEPYVLFGPWRPVRPDDTIVNPEHISNINGEPFVPVRIYGHKPITLELAEKGNPDIKHINATNKILPT